MRKKLIRAFAQHCAYLGAGLPGLCVRVCGKCWEQAAADGYLSRKQRRGSDAGQKPYTGGNWL